MLRWLDLDACDDRLHHCEDGRDAIGSALVGMRRLGWFAVYVGSLAIVFGLTALLHASVSVRLAFSSRCA